MDDKQMKNFIEFLVEDDKAFYERFLCGLSEEELQEFMRENPEFKME